MARNSIHRLIVFFLLLTGSVSIHGAADIGELTFNSGERQVQLVELYTSQGCSSCPPADRWINKLIEAPELWNTLVPVAFHVDYWDYLGWRDIYAAKGYSDRQRRYRNQGGVRSVYTPGFVVDGREWRGWFARNPLPDSLTPSRELSAVLNDGGLKVSYPQGDNKLVLNVAVLGFGIETPIGAGENEGSHLQHDFVVLAHDQHISDRGMWDVQLPYTRVRGAKRFALALWVNKPGQQMPLQATGGWLGPDWIRRI